MTDKREIHFIISEKGFEMLTSLKHRTKEETYTGVIRNALSFYEVLLDHAHSDGTFTIKGKDGEYVFAL